MGAVQARRALGRDLVRLCREAGIGLRVVSRDLEIELRMPPLAVKLDMEAGRASFLFARERLACCKAEAAEIVRTHGRVVGELQRPFDAPAYFDACLRAYSLLLKNRGLEFGARVELREFVPCLGRVLGAEGYGKARFVFDVHRLRAAGMLSRKGLRINFGVATGGTALDRRRVIYMEDPQGHGEYKLTVFFTGGAWN